MTAYVHWDVCVCAPFWSLVRKEHGVPPSTTSFKTPEPTTFFFSLSLLTLCLHRSGNRRREQKSVTHTWAPWRERLGGGRETARLGGAKKKFTSQISSWYRSKVVLFSSPCSFSLLPLSSSSPVPIVRARAPSCFSFPPRAGCTCHRRPPPPRSARPRPSPSGCSPESRLP